VKSSKNKKRALSISDDDDDDREGIEDGARMTPIKLDFGGSPRSRTGATMTRGSAESSRA